MFALIERILARRQVEPPKFARQAFSLWPGRSDAGIFVTEDRALQNSTAFACGSLIARTIAMLPARVMAPRSRDPEDGNERLPDHPVDAIFRREANAESSPF